MTQVNRLMIAGGGTGGHVYPGVAVAEAWMRLVPNADVVFVGSERGMESRIVPAHGFRLRQVETHRLKNAGLVERVRGLVRMPLALWSAGRVVSAEAPVAVLGVGGFVSGPVVLSAALMGRPCAVAEQNALPGLTNRLLARFVRRVYTAFPEAAARLPRGKVSELGNPIRQEIRALSDVASSSQSACRVLVMGGSQGARSLNERVPAALAALAAQAPITVRHQCGRGNAPAVRAAYETAGLTGVAVDEYIDDVAAALRDADVVVARAGATTVAELACVGRPAVFIPFPFAADDHQTVNARSLVEAGAARMVADSTLSTATLCEALEDIVRDPSLRRDMASRALTRGRPRAAVDIVRDLWRLAGRPDSELIAPIQEATA